MPLNVILPSPPGFPSSSSPSITGGSPVQLVADPFPDQLSQLNPFFLKTSASDPGICFPGLAFRERRSNSLAVHRYPNQPGAYVENLGENEGHHFIRAILTNNIYPGPTETWTPGTLFPNVYISLLNLLRTPGDKVFTHPIYGNLTVQVVDIEPVLDANKVRDGAIIDFELIETIGKVNIQDTITNLSSNALAASATALDNAIAGPNVGGLPGMSLASMFTNLTNAVVSALATPNAIVGAINQDINSTIQTFQINAAKFDSSTAYTSNFVNFSIYTGQNTVLNATVNNTVSYDPSAYQAMSSIITVNSTPSQNAAQLLAKIQQATLDLMTFYINQNTFNNSIVIEALRTYLFAIQNVVANNTVTIQATTATYVTTTQMSWVALASFLNNNINDLTGLNQSIVNQIYVPAQTQIIYLTQA
jgi:prophage DNA circulation protein